MSEARDERRWVDLSTPQYFRFDVYFGDRHLSTITKQRVRGARWHGWHAGKSQKFGPFTKAQARLWAWSAPVDAAP